MASGVSRQSLYNLFHGGPVFNTPVLKVTSFLRIDPEDLLEKKKETDVILESAPDKIKKAILHLQEFSEKYEASLILFGSRSRGKVSLNADWDLGLYFHKGDRTDRLRPVKRNLQESVFPYRMDVVNLNSAPSWFLNGVYREHLLVSGPPLPHREVA